MSNEEILTDDYVAELLSREASDCSIKYSAVGVDAFLGRGPNSKKPTNMPKPNTRFLRNIIKGTDSHNKALLAREAAESKAHLKRLERAEEIKRKKMNPTTRDIRERHIGDIRAILGGGKRRRRGDDDDDNEDRESDSHDRAKSKRKTRTHESDDTAGVGSQERRRSSPGRQSDNLEHHRRYRDDGRRSRHRDHSSDGKYQSRWSKSSRDDRSRSPQSGHRSKRTRSRDAERRRHRHRSPPRKKSTASTNDEDMPGNSQDEDIGPAPPPRIRGRGAVGPSSGIDRRFSASYDPRKDMQGDDDVGA